MRQHPEELVDPLLVETLDRIDRQAVELLPAALQEASVGGLLDQRVVEGQRRHRLPPGVANQLGALQLAHGVGVQRAPGDGLEESHRELPPEHRSQAEQVVRARAQPVDAREDHLLDGLREVHGDLAIERPAAVALHQRPGADQRADQLLQVERVALGACQQAALELGRNGR